MKHTSIRYVQALTVVGCFVGVLAFAASKSEDAQTIKNKEIEREGEFENWRNKPHEPFTNGAETFEQVKKMLLEHYYDQNLTEEDLYRAAVQGMIANIDPDKSAWNRLLTPKEMKELMSDMTGKFVGIGVEIGFESESGIVSILDVIKDTPAEDAGLKKGQKILKIDDKSFNGKQFRDAVYAMRGTPGSKVTLTVLDQDKIRKFVVKRAPLVWETVTAEVLPDGVGLLTVRYFSEQTPGAIKKSLAKLQSQNIKSLIVDLRGNEGGLLESAIESLNQLLPKGAVIAKVVKRGGSKEDLIAKSGSTFPKMQLAVLVNKDTKSSAEIAAGTLQQNCNATLIGHTTFGKWSSQKVEDLPNKYAVKFTTATYLAPNGQDFSGVGLTPDIPVEGDDATFQKLRLESDLKKRMASDAQLQAAVYFLKRKD